MKKRLEIFTLVLAVLVTILTALVQFAEFERIFSPKVLVILAAGLLSAFVTALILLNVYWNSPRRPANSSVPDYNRPSALSLITSVLFGWDELKVLSEYRVFKLSYASLPAIPLLIYILTTDIGYRPIPNFAVPLNLKLSYFSAFSFAIALIILAIFCPKEIKQSSGDLGTAVNPTSVAQSRLLMRALCTLCYAIGVILLVVVLVRSAIYVLYA